MRTLVPQVQGNCRGIRGPEGRGEEEKRRQYDQMGHGAHASTGGHIHIDFADINIEKFFKKPNGFDESDLFGNDTDSYSCRSSIEIKMEAK